MESVAIGSANYDSYVSLSEADLYMDAAAHGGNWRAADEPTKSRALVTSTRTLDRQSWKEEYNTQALRFAVANIKTACIELALAIVEGSEVQNLATTEDTLRSMTAGSVSITNARATSIQPTRFPLIVQELLRDYLGGTSDGMYAQVTGADEETIFPLETGFNGGV